MLLRISDRVAFLFERAADCHEKMQRARDLAEREFYLRNPRDRGQRFRRIAGTVPTIVGSPMEALQTTIRSIEKRLRAQHRASVESRRIESIPGIGMIDASAITDTVMDPKAFCSGRDFAPWIGLVPRQDFDRRQTEAWADFEAGRPLHTTHSGRRSACGPAAWSPTAGKVPLAHPAPRGQTVQGRGGGAGQQDGARPLGTVGQGWDLSGTCARVGIVRGLATGK